MNTSQISLFFCVIVALSSGNDAFANNYTTSFPLTENPISEGGRWINGKAVGLDWSNVSTTPGLAFGLESGSTGYDDATALLNGSWGPNQTVKANVHKKNPQGGNIFEEVEVRLRSSLSAHSCTGYEVIFSMKNDANAYVQIVRWNGPLSSFTLLDARGGSQYVLQEGDEVKGTISGSTIAAYIRGTKVLEVTDGTYASGNPGMGFFLQGATGLNSDYGFTSFTASDGVATSPTPNLAITGPNSNGTFTLQFNSIPATTWQIQYTPALASPNWVPLGTGTTNGAGLFQFTDTPAPGTPRRFYRAVSQ